MDSLNNRIQKFTKDGKFLAMCGREGSGHEELSMPWGIDIDKEGYIYVADWRNDRIQKFTADGRFVMQFGTSGIGEGELNGPAGVAVDQDGIIYVTDWGNDRLHGMPELDAEARGNGQDGCDRAVGTEGERRVQQGIDGRDDATGAGRSTHCHPSHLCALCVARPRPFPSPL